MASNNKIIHGLDVDIFPVQKFNWVKVNLRIVLN